MKNWEKLISVEAENKLNDRMTSYIKLINDLSGEITLISTKGLAKHFINGYR